jgi:hypothetical protein
MSFKVLVRSSIRRRIAAWAMPDVLLVDVYLRLQDDLGKDPWGRMVRVSDPFDGMVYGFSLVDPTNRFREHWFVFHVRIHADEETLEVVNAGHSVTEL